MPGSKEIRTKIKSVQNTRKITKAMEMVAASKMRRAQDRMRAARPYGEKIRNVAAHISHANPEYHHPFLVSRDTVQRIGIIVITTDKGLCGGLNTNILRAVTTQMREVQGAEALAEFLADANALRAEPRHELPVGDQPDADDGAHDGVVDGTGEHRTERISDRKRRTKRSEGNEQDHRVPETENEHGTDRNDRAQSSERARQDRRATDTDQERERGRAEWSLCQDIKSESPHEGPGQSRFDTDRDRQDHAENEHGVWLRISDAEVWSYR